MSTVTDDQVIALLPDLAEAARANERTLERFVPARPGIVEEAAARRHQFIHGRRGVGKSTLLRKVQEQIEATGNPAAFIDLETMRGIEYPDVLIQLLVQVLQSLDAELKKLGGNRNVRERAPIFRVRLRLRGLRRNLAGLLQEPQEAKHSVRKLKSKARRWGGGGEVAVGAALRTMRASLGVDAHRSSTSSEATTVEAEFSRTKMDGLFASANTIRSVLTMALTNLGRNASAYVTLDDFHHIALDDQPKVLAYLHQVIKNLPIWLKVGGVRHRLNPYVEGDPPMGLQIGHDASDLSLDVTLERFETAQDFLERVLQGITAARGVEVDDLLTEGGRTRLVLASGGVARDYLSLSSIALRTSTERPATQSRPHNRITAEDVNEASAQISAQKQKDLALDSGPNADNVRKRLSHIASFSLDYNQTNAFLVEGTKLEEEDWGKEIAALADLRLLHKIGNTSVQSSDYRGRRFVAFTLDLSNYTGTRSERIRQIDFWTPSGKQDLRRVGLIYDPDLDEGPRSKTQPKRAPVDWTTQPLPGLELQPDDSSGM